MIGELPLNIPDEAFYHHVMKEMQELLIDMLIIDNVRSPLVSLKGGVVLIIIHVFIQDLASWNVEQAIGNDGWNILTVIMRQFGVDINDAMKKAHEYHYE